MADPQASAPSAAGDGGGGGPQRVPLDAVPADLQEQVWAEIRAGLQAARGNSTAAAASMWEDLQAFAAAVDWSERWIQGVLAAHVATFALVLLLRRNTTFLASVFAVLGSLVYFGERVNALAARHWRRFARQDYFDARGVFYNAVVSAPALLTLLTVLVFYLLAAAGLMVEVKKRELLATARARRRAEQQAAAGGKKRQ